MILIDWRSLTDRGFESLCYDVLVREGYTNLVWLGRRGDDRARDIVGEFPVRFGTNVQKNLKCVVQCKRYIARPPSPTDLEKALAWANAHRPDVLVIMVTNTLSADTHDWIELQQPKLPYRVVAYEEKNLETFFDSNPDVYEKHFGKPHAIPKKRVIVSLLDSQSKTLEIISEQSGISKEDVSSALVELQEAGLIDAKILKGEEHYSLQKTLESLVQIARQSLEDEDRFDILASEYFQSLINRQIVEHISSRYHVTFPEETAEGLVKLLRISPSALRTGLFSDTKIYETGFKHAQELKLDEAGRKQINDLFITSLILEMLEGTITDLRDTRSKAALKRSNVEGYSVGIDIKMAGQLAEVLSLHFETIAMILPSAGPIEAGQLLAPVDPGAYLKTGNILLQLGYQDGALRDYDRAIQLLTDKRGLAIAWNNKGVCLMRQKKNEDARKCFEKALEIDPSLDVIRKNLERL